MMDDETRVIMLESELAAVRGDLARRRFSTSDLAEVGIDAFGEGFDAGATHGGIGWYIPPAAIQEILKVLRHGDEKHPGDEWETILPHVHEACAAGHINEYENGREREDESGCHHLAHAIVRYMFALSLWLSAKSKEHRHIDAERDFHKNVKTEE